MNLNSPTEQKKVVVIIENYKNNLIIYYLGINNMANIWLIYEKAWLFKTSFYLLEKLFLARTSCKYLKNKYLFYGIGFLIILLIERGILESLSFSCHIVL